MDDDVDALTRDELIAEVKRMRAAIRRHRDSTGHELCWHHPELWRLLPEQSDPQPVVPDWPQFLRGCIRYRQSLDEQLPDARREQIEFDAARKIMASHNMMNDERDIRALIENWAAAVRRKDLGGILKHHAPDIVMFDVPPPLQSKGIDAYKKTWDLFYSWSHTPVVFNITEMHVTAGDEVAFATALMKCSGTEKNGTDLALDFRLTVGLQKIDRQWVITHEHHSIPAED